MSRWLPLSIILLEVPPSVILCLPANKWKSSLPRSPVISEKIGGPLWSLFFGIISQLGSWDSVLRVLQWIQWYLVYLVTHLNWPGFLDERPPPNTMKNLNSSPHVAIKPTMDQSLIIELEENIYCTSVSLFWLHGYTD